MKTFAALGAENVVTPTSLKVVSVDVEINQRVWSPEIIQRVLLMLNYQIVHFDVEEDLFPKTVIKLKFLSPDSSSEEIANLFHAKLISASATMNHLERVREIQNYFAQTAFHVTTAVRNQIEEEFRKKKIRPKQVSSEVETSSRRTSDS